MHTCVIKGQVGSDKNLICQVGKCDVMYHMYVCAIMLYYTLCIDFCAYTTRAKVDRW